MFIVTIFRKFQIATSSSFHRKIILTVKNNKWCSNGTTNVKKSSENNKWAHIGNKKEIILALLVYYQVFAFIYDVTHSMREIAAINKSCHETILKLDALNVSTCIPWIFNAPRDTNPLGSEDHGGPRKRKIAEHDNFTKVSLRHMWRTKWPTLCVF